MKRRSEAGARFHGDFQGLENWTSERDVIEELDEFGILPTFEHKPFRECVFFGPTVANKSCVRNGPSVSRSPGHGPRYAGCGSQREGPCSGVKIEFGRAIERLPAGGIVAHGPHRVDAIAVGWVFETDMADAAYGVVSDDLAPAGYGYLLTAGVAQRSPRVCSPTSTTNAPIWTERWSSSA